jgi:transmembrane sensor
LFLGCALWLEVNWHQPSFTQLASTVRGEQKDLILPDGTQIRLDTNTRVDVALYRHHREIRLVSGQAMFDVAPDAGRPFNVVAGPLRITVLGTRFAVRYTATGLQTSGANVAVVEGHVRVSAATSRGSDADATSAPVDVHQGQAISVDATGKFAAVMALPKDLVAPWSERRIVFQNTPIAQALAEFARYGETGMVIDPGATDHLRITGSFDTSQVAAFRRALPAVLAVKLVRQGGVVGVSAMSGSDGPN